MIEQLGTEKAKYVSKPCYEMIEYLEKSPETIPLH